MMSKYRVFLILSVSLIAVWACGTDSSIEQDETGDEVEVVTTDDSAEATDANSEDHDSPEDYVWTDTDVIPVVLNGSSITVNATGATVSGSKLTLTAAGTYSISGTLTNGQIIVNTADQTTVRLILNGAVIACATGAPIHVAQAKKTIVVLADNTQNSLTDGTTYTVDTTLGDAPTGALFCMSDLTCYGAGSLTVKGNYKDGIVGKDGLIVKSGTINVTAADDGIRGKDYLVVKGGLVSVIAKGDGLKSDNDVDVTKGFVSIETGTLNIVSGADGIQAATDVIVLDGTITLVTGGGSSSYIGSAATAKGIKASVSVIIDGGVFSFNTADDAIHSNNAIAVNGGTITITPADDGIHADTSLLINGGDITVTKSYEGIESALINIADGNIHVASTDDGVNVAGGADSSSPNQFTANSNQYLYIKGGYVVVNAVGDGIDVNGSVVMTNGTVIVNGPTSNGNAALDYDGTFKISGGFLVAVGSTGMAQIPGSTSTQSSVLIIFSASQKAGSLVHIQTADGADVLTFAPSKNYQSVAFSSPNLKSGSAYELYTGGSSSGTVADGLYAGGTYTAGSKLTGFTQSGVATKVSR